ncbi:MULTISPECIES: fatty acyl-AMP ligase [Moorena]|uniref:Acyl-CoA synthetase/AMP-acid ligase II n=1 Tax=Moorena producens 3L TaxID=489825 RepID=F4XRP6_9CYAN|nr:MULTISPECIES: fatty acyl-AMP ligase [Moorena]AEF01450.1 putative AMP-forming acyl-CoA synthetase/AMP-acid ligase II [Moorena producens 3L]EGJ32724.1 acyl-CoA synthetase/AMP-acid ligase II [Moorena producens 3L]NEP69835.1 fatty acyl-AMP ligase [Moorena sp. SIO3A5]NER91286.1 fatty acyl-AMP ligase [Moorena sp. SIO3A2]NES41134.1 fatty acyl-AMP ligase [Moorena sp. SIO2C4]
MKNEQEFSTLIDLLQYRSHYQSARKAYSFLQNGEKEVNSLSYKELDEKARAIAVELQKQVDRNERALLLYPQGLEFIAALFGCLYAGVVAIPAPPPDPIRLKRTLPRLEAIVFDAQASVILTDFSKYSQLKESTSQLSSEFQSIKWIVSDKIPISLSQKWQKPDLNGDTLAYLQYTSGSTSTPKGVMLTHKNLIHHCSYIKEAWGYTSDSIATTWVPHFHDYGLVDGLIQPLYSGIPCYVMSPIAFYMRPIRWLQTISRYRVTHSQGPNFAYEHCLRRTTAEQRANLDLSSWRTASNGAEPVRQETVENFIATFEPFGFRRDALYPAYGLAEATLLVSTKKHGEKARVLTLAAEALEKNKIVVVSPADKDQVVRFVVSCGPPIGGMKVAIVNRNTLRKCQPDQVGEIWVCDPSMAVGYWHRLEETEKTFHANLAESGEGPFMRTGDLGFLKDGELFITGRIKDVIIIRGRNHYPQDIELTVEKSHPSLRSSHGAALAVEIKGEERLIVVQEVERSYQKTLDLNEVVGNIREAVTDEHDLQVYSVVLIKAGSIPKTSSGKIQRSACRVKFLEGTLDQLEARGKVASKRQAAVST